MPIGSLGEICLAGSGIAHGYIDAPGATAERFQPDPLGPPGTRLYATGDIGRWNPDGTVSFVGRRDHQVKVRGHRVEVGEVERVLSTAPTLAHGVVVPSSAKGETALVAHVEPASADLDAVRTHLRCSLPEWAVPKRIIVYDRLPRTSHGKIDAAALCVATRETTSFAPSGSEDVASLMAQLWRLVLGVDVTTADDWFRLGADSMDVIEFVRRARTAGLEVSVRDVFQRRTSAELADVVQLAPDAAWHEAGSWFGLLPAQRRFLSMDVADRNHWNQSMVLDLPPDIDPTLIESALRKVVAHNGSLRLQFDPERKLQRYLSDALLDVRHVPPAKFREAFAACHRSLDIARGRVVGAVLSDGARPRLGIAAHHLCIDNVSWDVVQGDLEVAYDQLVHGLTPQLVPRVPLSDVVTRIEEYEESDECVVQLPYWREIARRAGHELPCDAPGSNIDSETGVAVASLSEETTSRLLLPNIQGSTLDVLAAALIMAVRQWSGRDSVGIEVESHGRQHVAVPDTVGWFTLRYPVLIDRQSSSLADVAAAFRRARDRASGDGVAYALLRWGRLPRIGAPSPPVSLNYLGARDPVQSSSRFRRVAYDASDCERRRGGSRAHVFEVECSVRSAKLHVAWEYPAGRYSPAGVNALVQDFVQRVDEAVAPNVADDSLRLGGLTDAQLARIAARQAAPRDTEKG